MLAYVEALAAFAASGLGRAQHAYLAGGRLPAAELLGDLTIGAWRWASDLGLWAKGRSKAAKVWRAGRPGTLARAIRWAGAPPQHSPHTRTAERLAGSGDILCAGMRTSALRRAGASRADCAVDGCARPLRPQHAQAPRRGELPVLAGGGRVGTTWAPVAAAAMTALLLRLIMPDEPRERCAPGAWPSSGRFHRFAGLRITV